MKNQNTKSDRGRQASAMVVVMTLVILAVFITGSMAAFSTSLAPVVRRMAANIRAKAIAEAGLNRAYALLAEDFSRRTASPLLPSTSFGGGSYDVRVESVGTRAARVYSTGRFGPAEARLCMLVENRNETAEERPSDPLSPWGRAIFANGNLRLNGTPPAVRGDLHSNQQFRLSGRPDNILGTVTARTFNWSGGVLPPSQIGVFQEIRFPQLSDEYFVRLYAAAQARNAIRPGGTYREADLSALSGGVVWFTGDVTFHGSFQFTGDMVVAGNITFQGSGTRVLNGLLYTPGHVTANGATTLMLTGAMLAGGNIEFNGASSIFTHAAVGPAGEQDPTETDRDRVVVSALWEG